MPIIAKEKLNALVSDGKARLDQPGRFQIPKPPKESQKLNILRSMQTAIEKLADMKGGNSENIALLQSIEALLRQLISLSAPRPAEEPPRPAERKKKKWVFKIKRDGQGRLETISAVPEGE
jgi:hypothetical protein